MSFVLSYGTGAFGRLGLGSLTHDEPTPRFIDLIPPTNIQIACISAGLYHSAIVTMDRRVFLTGTNATGCLAEVKSCGQFRLVESLHPRHDIVQVSCGGDLLGAHTLAVSRSGRLYAWGMTRACGLGPLEDEVVARPTLVTEFARNDLLNPNSEQEIVALERVAFATAGGSCSAIITTEGSLFTFGITAGGRLGLDRKRSVEWRPKRVDALLGETVVAVSAGGAHMLCVTERGVLYAWGDNSRGQVGTGDFTDRFRPVRIPHPTNSAWAPIIAAGEGHSMAVDVNGRLFTWGGCGGPMLGRACIGNSVSAETGERERALSISFKLSDVRSDYTKPRLVSCLSDYRIVRIGAGARHSLAVTSEGLVFSWGSKAQVGIPGHHQLVTVPRLVSLPTTRIGAVSCGSYHTLIVTDDSIQSPVLQYIAATMMNPKPSPLTHDCFISTIDGTKVWLNAAVLKSRLNYVGFNSFIKPQLEMVDTNSPPPSPKDSLSLGRLAEEFRFTQTEEEQVDGEYDRLGKIIGDWIITSDNPGSSSEIPDDCLFANLSRTETLKFFTLLFLDELPDDIDDAMTSTLLKLSICCQFERGVFLLTPTTSDGYSSRERNNYPTSSVGASMDELYRQRESSGANIVKIQCGLPIYRDTVTEDSDLQIPIHGFVLEAMITTVSERNRFLSSSRDVPVDVMDELVFFWYHFHLNRNELEAEIDLSRVFDSEESKAIAFWNRLLGVAQACGSRYAAAAARDHLVSMISDSNWIEMMASEARESAMCVAQQVLTKNVLSHASFAQPSGYIHSDKELPGVVERILSADSQLDGEEELKQRVLKQVTGHCSTARKIQSKLEYYQTMNLEPVNAKSSVKSMFVSIRNGPSLAVAGRDLVLAVAIIAVFGWLWTSSSAAATESTRLGSFMSNNSLFVKVFIIGVNFALLTATVFLFQRFSHKNPPKTAS